jgi:hypothetical protein
MAIGLRQALLRRFLTLHPREASFEVRGFAVSDHSRRLERIGETFIGGFNAGLLLDDSSELQQFTDQMEAEWRGFAVEGAAMGAAIADAVSFRTSRLPAWLRRTEEHYTYLAHVGTGWALARFPWRRSAIIAVLDPVHCWLAYDGLGFHDAYFHPVRIRAWRRVVRGYESRAYDQGIGRGLWFVSGGDVDRAIELANEFHPDRKEDVWSGLGLAVAYAGGGTPTALSRLVRAAGSHRSSLAQGAAFAAEARSRAGFVPACTVEALRALAQMEVEAAAALVRDLRDRLPRHENSSVPRYEIWRQRLREALGRR